MLFSNYSTLVPVALPFKGRSHYMHSFDLANPVRHAGFEDYLETVRALCKAAGALVGMAHMTVDEKIVKAGMSQRRPRPTLMDASCRPPWIGDMALAGTTCAMT